MQNGFEVWSLSLLICHTKIVLKIFIPFLLCHPEHNNFNFPVFFGLPVVYQFNINYTNRLEYKWWVLGVYVLINRKKGRFNLRACNWDLHLFATVEDILYRPVDVWLPWNENEWFNFVRTVENI